MTRIAPALLATVGLALVSLGLVVMALTTEVDSSWTAILPGLLVGAVGTGLINPAGSALALNALPHEQSGLASGVNDTFRQTGVAVGIAFLGIFVPAAGPFGTSPQEYVDGVHHAMFAAAILALACAAGTGFLLLRRSEEPEPEPVVEPV